jgi:hypothetical protein
MSPKDGYMSPKSGYMSPKSGDVSPKDGYMSPKNGYMSPKNGLYTLKVRESEETFGVITCGTARATWKNISPSALREEPAHHAMERTAQNRFINLNSKK